MLLVLGPPAPLPLKATVPVKLVAGSLKKSCAEIVTVRGAPTDCGEESAAPTEMVGLARQGSGNGG